MVQSGNKGTNNPERNMIVAWSQGVENSVQILEFGQFNQGVKLSSGRFEGLFTSELLGGLVRVGGSKGTNPLEFEFEEIKAKDSLDIENLMQPLKIFFSQTSPNS